MEILKSAVKIQWWTKGRHGQKGRQQQTAENNFFDE
jgi:hypothetical protein